MIRTTFALLAALALPAAAHAQSPAPVSEPAPDLRLFSVGSGDVSGTYFATTSAICDLVNRTGAGRLRCSPEATQGSICNLSALHARQMDFALVQSDWQRFAWEGELASAAMGPMSELRSVMALYSETPTILARREAGMAGIADLAGRRVDIGPHASGRRGTALSLLDALGLGAGDFAALTELPTSVALCEGHLDATIPVTGHPNAAITRALRDCEVGILPIAPATVARLRIASPDCLFAAIPADAYPGLDAPVLTAAITATLVTRADVEDALVARLVSETIAGLPLLAVSVPSLAGASIRSLREGGPTAPTHPGAVAAFEAAAGP